MKQVASRARYVQWTEDRALQHRDSEVGIATVDGPDGRKVGVRLSL
jgi:hypothetical protein